MIMKEFTKFLNNLRFNLYFFDEEEIEQIILDYKDIYDSKIAEGKSESEILNEFDSAKEIANNYKEELEIKDNPFNKYFVNGKKEIALKNKQISSKVKELLKKSKKEVEVYNNEEIEEKEDGIIKIFFKKCLRTIIFIFSIISVIIKSFIRILLVFLIILAIVLYVLSFVFIDINVYTFYIRFLETTTLISSLICAWILLKALSSGKHE